jgi:hypothetical protein
MIKKMLKINFLLFNQLALARQIASLIILNFTNEYWNSKILQRS